MVGSDGASRRQDGGARPDPERGRDEGDVEETGLDLIARGHPLGQLESVSPSSRRLPRLTISPFVFGVDGGSTARVASHEVADVFWVGVDTLSAPAVGGEVMIEHGGMARSFPCYRIGDEVVWGLTYRIVSNFLDALRASGQP